jgi:hypothetical protein
VIDDEFPNSSENSALLRRQEIVRTIAGLVAEFEFLAGKKVTRIDYERGAVILHTENDSATLQ